MLNVGIDSVDIERFSTWHTFTHKKLARIFTSEEITYCLSHPVNSAERFAVRFAAKEAFYKALSPLIPNSRPFLTIARTVSVIKHKQGIPYLHVVWETLSVTPYTLHVSLTHTKSVATAIVIISE